MSVAFVNTGSKTRREKYYNDAEQLRVFEEAEKSLARIQEFKTESLSRSSELGTALNFEGAVAFADRLIGFYRQLPVEVLEQLPQSKVDIVRQQADGDYHILTEIVNFSADITSPIPARDSLIDRLRKAYDPCFDKLSPIVAFAVNKAMDLSELERDARAKVQFLDDRVGDALRLLNKSKEESDTILEAVRRTAAEQGVSQQATYFQTEAENHENAAKAWLTFTERMTIVLTAYALTTLFLHKIPFFKPENSYDAAQLVVGKVMVFGTLSYYLFLSAKNFLAHRHNEVVNKHRRNALITYEALVSAAGDSANRDIVLTKASECIFSAQATGFGKGDSSDGTYSVVNVAPGAIKPGFPGG